MRIHSINLHTVTLPLVTSFAASFGTQTERTALLVELHGDVDGQAVTGWGECVAFSEPVYSSEYVEGASNILTRHLLPLLFRAQEHEPAYILPDSVERIFRPVVGHPMAKAAVEMALLDATLRARKVSLAQFLGGVSQFIPAGVSIGLQPSVRELLDAVSRYREKGYTRIKLKIMPGWDVEPVRAVRECFGDDLLLQVDANAAYALSDTAHLRELDNFGLLLIEQPLGERDMRQHAELAQRLRTPICLDESVTSAQAAADAIMLGAASIINIKAGRVGGYLEARKIHDLAQAHGVAVWCGGMLETGLGRAANAALASLPGFTLPGDVSASSRFYKTDITAPIVLEDGQVRVPTGPGLGVQPVPELLARFSVRTVECRPE